MGGGGSKGEIVNKVPIMTSNTTPSGVAYSYPTNSDAYKAFDRETYLTSGITITGGSPSYVGYAFNKPTVIKMVGFAGVGTATADSYFLGFTLTVRGINGSASTTIKSFTISQSLHKGAYRDFIYLPIFENETAYDAYEIDITTNYQYQWNTVLGGIQLLGVE